jgi:alkylation response protein AidB-like acyl-CoA dehydrogenase
MTTAGATFELRTDLAKRAESLLPLLDAHQHDSDSLGELAPEVVEAFHREGMFKMWVPERLGGSELGPLDALEVIQINSYGDPSAGWVQMAACLSTGTAAAYLGPSAVAELFADGGYPVIAGQGTRPGTARTVDGGYMLSGEWSFASGLKHGTHIHTLAIIQETGEPRIFVLPVGQAELFQESWDVLGLRGTGSIDYHIHDVFVPEEYTHFAFSRDGSRGDIYRLGVIAFASVCHTGWAMGVGRRLLDELRQMTLAKKGRAGTAAESDHFQIQFAEAEAKFRAARAFALETWRDVEATFNAGQPVTVRQDTLIRLAMGHITKTLFEIASFVYLAGGTTALRRGPIERMIRDVHAGSQHITSAPNSWRNCGRELAGLAEGMHWILFDLVPDEG